MNVLIFGASGRTGQILVRKALEHGHTVTAFARRPESFPIKHERLRLARGDVRDEAAVQAAVTGQDAVMSAVGAATLGADSTCSDASRNIVAAMQKTDVKRYVCLGTGGVDNEGPWFFVRVIKPIFFRHVVRDKALEEEIIKASGLDWVVVRAPRLTDSPARGNYRVDAYKPLKNGWKISREDIASFMIEQLTSSDLLRSTPRIAY